MVLALGDIATQVAQYKMFSSWFPPSNGFASTLGFELAIGKVDDCIVSAISILTDYRLVVSSANPLQMLSPRYIKPFNY